MEQERLVRKRLTSFVVTETLVIFSLSHRTSFELTDKQDRRQSPSCLGAQLEPKTSLILGERPTTRLHPNPDLTTLPSLASETRSSCVSFSNAGIGPQAFGMCANRHTQLERLFLNPVHFLHSTSNMFFFFGYFRDAVPSQALKEVPQIVPERNKLNKSNP